LRLLKPRLNSLKKNDLINVASKYTIDTANKNKQEIIGLLIENGYDDNENKKICANAERIKLIRDKIQVLENDIFDTNTGKAIAEKYFLGISLSASPADDADSSQASHTCLEIAKAANGSGITVCAIIDSVKPTKTKKGKAPGSKMCFLTISDSTYSLDHCVVFPDAFEEISQFCQENYICLFYGEKKNGSFIISNAKKLI
jgi:DNA polymerase III alpha subunit